MCKLQRQVYIFVSKVQYKTQITKTVLYTKKERKDISFRSFFVLS